MNGRIPSIPYKEHPMTRDEIEDVAAMEQETFGRMAWSERDFESAIRNDYDLPYVVSTPEGQLVGYGVLRLLGPDAEVENICVSRVYRGEGFGEHILDILLSKAAEMACSRVFLEVRSRNETAISLYKKKGFTPSYVRKAYYSFPDDDAVVMEKRF